MRRFLVLTLTSILLLFFLTQQIRAAQTADWHNDWAVADGFSLERDSQGYNFPTALAFIPHPGTAPDDPLYFVTEIRGTIKVVSNDRTVHIFAQDFFELHPSGELPHGSGEIGLAGICLAPQQGYIFVTFAYQDDHDLLRNNIIRFETTPETFALAPRTQVAFTEIFAADESSTSHQIGSCQVQGDLLYVSVGDGHQIDRSQQPNSTLGKVLRMTLDGQPVPDNPFWQDDDKQKAANYVWARGFRNPFGLQVVGDQVFVADNGLNVDRFVEAVAGGNYLWDGSDWSSGSNTILTLTPSIGVVQMAFLEEGSAVFPSPYPQNFFLALSGNLPWTRDPAARRPPGIIAIPYDFANGRIPYVPDYILRYRDSHTQMVAGVAFGADGLYFAPLYPDANGERAIYKLAYTPEQPHPHLLAIAQDAAFLMTKHGCLACHSLNGTGGSAAPPLDREALVARVQARLQADSYWQALAGYDEDETQPPEWQAIRQRLRETREAEQVTVWVQSRIQEPRFDNPHIQMPNFGLSAREAATIAHYLVTGEDTAVATPHKLSLTSLAQRFIPTPITPLHLVIIFAGGFVAGILFLLVLRLLVRRVFYRSRGT
jgi:glucose/arabinose dehydrogenase/mono/diheme cytochrome c family protein